MRRRDVIVQRRRAAVLLATAAFEKVNFPMRQDNWLAHWNMEKLEQSLLFQAEYGAIWYFSFMCLANMQRKLLDKAKKSETAATKIDALAYVLSIAAVDAGPPSFAQHALVDPLIALLSLIIKGIFFLFLHIAEKIFEFAAFFLLAVAALFWLFEFFDIANQFGNSPLFP